MTRRIFCRHPDLTIFMRSKLLNWLFEVSHLLALKLFYSLFAQVALHFRLSRVTLYLSLHYTDTFLARWTNFKREEYQLLGLAALLLASKVEEMRPPTLPELVQICEHSYSCKDIAAFELKLCRVLKWNLIKDTPITWLEFYADALSLFLAASEVNRLVSASLRLIDLCLHSPISLNFTSSSLAAAALLHHFNSSVHSMDYFILATTFKPVQLESELLWLRSYVGAPSQVSYVDPKYPLTEDEFDF